MRLDRLQVAVRPRGVLECLDLAIVVCARRPVGVAVAAALGAVPMMLLNRAVFGGATTDGAALLLVLAAVMELPWAMAPLTVFLGQAMFADRFGADAWRACLRQFAGALWPLVLYQFLGRGLALASCAGAVVWLPFAYYLGPVVLLEHGRTSRVPGRCVGLWRCAAGRILLLIVIDAALIGIGWLVGLWFLDSMASLWSGRAVTDMLAAAFDAFAEDGDAAATPLEALLSWPSQIAFWAAATLVTVYRFLTYLDVRIRHEGWDVELAFRAPGTYAGLRSPRAAVGVAVVFLTLVVGGAAGGRPARAEAGPDAAGDAAARAAVEKQRFPWYDAQADAYRPMVRVDAPPSGVASPAVAGLDGVARGVMIAVLAAVVAAALWLLVRHGLRPRPVERRVRAVGVVLGTEAIEALPAAVRRHDGDLLAEAERLAGAGDFAGAMVLFHGWQLVQLHGQGAIELAKGKTNGRYAAEIAAARPALFDLFRRSNRLFEDAFFGRLPVRAADFADVWRRRTEFAAAPAREDAA